MGWYKLSLPVVACAFLVYSGCGGSSAPKSSSSGGGSSPPASSSADSDDGGGSDKAEAVEEEVAAGGWGTLEGRFVVDGTVPVPAKVLITKDQEFCGKHDLVEESVVVSGDGGLANVVLSLYTKRGQDPPEPHESYGAMVGAEVELDNNKCRFEPHVCVLHTSQALVVLNSDEVGHNTKIETVDNPAFNQTIPANGEVRPDKFGRAERTPAAVACSIHPWMNAWLVVKDTPYVAVTDASGNFKIENLPSGKWTFHVWHEASGNVDEVNMGGKSEKWSKGRFDVTIKPDETTNLGDVKVSAAKLKG